MDILLSVLGKIDLFLLLLNADAHGKGLRLHGNALGMQRLEGVPGAVADGQHRLIAGDALAAFQLHPGKGIPFQQKFRNPAAKAHLTAQGDDLLSEALDYLQQHIRSHMGFGVIQNVLPGTKGNKLLQDPANSGIADTGIQFSIRKGPRAALTELDIAFGVQSAVLPESRHLFMTGLRILAPLQNDGALPRLSQNQGGEHTRRAKADDHRPLFRFRLFFRRPVTLRGGQSHFFASALFQNLPLAAFQGHIDRINELHIRLFPGIHRPTDQMQALNFRSRYPQYFRRLKEQGRRILLRTHGNISNTQHFFIPLSLHSLPQGFRSSRPTANCSRRSPHPHPALRRRRTVREQACFPW